MKIEEKLEIDEKLPADVTMNKRYEDGDLLLIDDIGVLSEPLHLDDEIRLDKILLLVCTNGRIRMRIRTKTVELNPCDVLCCAPNTVLDDIMISPGTGAKLMYLSTQLAMSIIRPNKKVWNNYYSISRNPVVTLDKSNLKLYDHYYSLLDYRLKHSDTVYNKDVLTSLISALLYEFLAELDKNNMHYSETSQTIMRSDILYVEFLELLSKTEPKARNIGYYSRELCVTPKHLSTVVKKTSGRTAFDWITAAVVEEIKQNLIFTTLSVKEISAAMNFPSLSSFGKFVKSRLGMSPTQYREQANKQNKAKSDTPNR